jgi:hypothetical protein
MINAQQEVFSCITVPSMVQNLSYRVNVFKNMDDAHDIKRGTTYCTIKYGSVYEGAFFEGTRTNLDVVTSLRATRNNIRCRMRRCRD